MEYSLELINNYINGEDLEGYNAEELENNPNFMKAVILASNDKKMYNLCSNDVRQNYDFVSFLIQKYSDDFKFIDIVASNYISIDHSPEDLASICVKMYKIFENKNDYFFAKYKIKFLACYMSEMLGVSIVRETSSDSIIGYGFVILEEIFGKRADALIEVTKQFIGTIIEENVEDLEELLHKEFNEANEIDKIGIVNYMINFLRRYDYLLADYVTVHTEVLNDLQTNIRNIQKRWNHYYNSEEAYDYEVMLNKVHDYMEAHFMDTSLTESELLYYIGKELGIYSKLVLYSGDTLEEYELFNDDIDIKKIQKSLEKLKNRIVYTNVKRIIIDSLFGEEKEEKDTPGEVIKVDFTKPRK